MGIFKYLRRTTTINELYEMYIKTTSKDSTRSTYKNLYDNHIEEYFGDLRVTKVNNIMINDFLNDKLQTYSESYVSNIKILLMSMLNYAKDENIISKKIKNILKIKVPKTIIEVFTEEEQQKLERYLLNNLDLTNLAILIALYTGIRIGELCALRIDKLDNGFLSVRHTLLRVKNLEENATTKTKIIIEAPKSNKSIRDVPIPNYIYNLCIKVLKAYNINSYVLTGTNRYIEPRTLENRFKKILNICDIEMKSFHTLRHTFATNCIVNNIYDIKTLSEILGHENTKTTMELYVHSNNSIKRKQSENLNEVFKNRINNYIQA